MPFADIQVGVARWRGLGLDTATPVTDTLIAPAAYGATTRELRGARLTHDADIAEIKDAFGRIVTVIASNERVSCLFTYKTLGATRAVAITSLYTPPGVAIVQIAGLPVIKFCPFADIFNSAFWIYKAGTTIDADPDNDWGITVTLTRYPTGALSAANTIVAT